MNINALIATLVAGSFFLIGALISKGLKKINNILDFTLGMAFAIALGLIVFDLLPEAIELFGHINSLYKAFLIFVYVVLGMMVLKIIDTLVPNHSHDKVKDHDDHAYHIGVVTTVGIIFHNIIEGIVIYSTLFIDFKLGLMLALGIAMHNIPMGMQIGMSLDKGKISKAKKAVILALLTLSTSFGALLVFMFNASIDSHMLGIMMSFTVGSLLYIAIFEIGKEIIKGADKIVSFIGVAVGMILIILSMLF